MSDLIYGIGNVKASEYDAVSLPRSLRWGSATPIVHMTHGAGQTEIDSPTWPTISKLIYKANEAGFPVVHALAGGDTFANDLMTYSATSYMQKMIDRAVTVVQNQFKGVTLTGRIHGFGLSMGAGCQIAHAGNNPTKVKSIVGGIPMVDLANLYNNATVGGVDFRTPIQTALGITYPAAIPSRQQLIATQAPLILAAGIPSLMMYANDDPYISEALVESFATAAGGEVYDLGALGHTHAAVAEGENYAGLTDWEGLIAWWISKGSG